LNILIISYQHEQQSSTGDRSSTGYNLKLDITYLWS